MNNRYIWFAFGIGASIGGAIALLYAPQTGVKARKQLRRGINEAADYLEDASDYLKDQADKLGSEAQKTLSSTKDKVSDFVDEAVDRSGSAVKSVKSMF